jgi:uncharacterized protein (TIGR02147 family)
MTSIFEYTDYRAYLKDSFAQAKKANPAFSHRYLSHKLGLSTPNLIMLIMQAKRNCTSSLAFRISQAFKLSKRESAYFEAMVGFAQAKAHQEKDRHYTRMLDLRKTVKAAAIDKKQYDYYNNWYNLAIRELVASPDYSGDYSRLAKMISPAITPEQARRSVELLLDLGLLKKHGKGYLQANPIISTGPEATSVSIANFHRKMAELAAQSYDRHPKNIRTITSCTLAISEERFLQIKKDIADFREKVMALAQEPKKGMRVYQLNLQLFPVSKEIE